MAADSYRNVLVFSDAIFKGSLRSVSSPNGTVETFFYDWLSRFLFHYYDFFARQTPQGGFTSAS